MSINRNTHKRSLCTDEWNVASRGSQEPNPVFPLGAVVPSSLVVFMATLYNVTTVNNENQLFVKWMSKRMCVTEGQLKRSGYSETTSSWRKPEELIGGGNIPAESCRLTQLWIKKVGYARPAGWNSVGKIIDVENPGMRPSYKHKSQGQTLWV